VLFHNRVAMLKFVYYDFGSKFQGDGYDGQPNRERISTANVKYPNSEENLQR